MQVNQKVQGEYCGFKFEGVITEMRRLTVKTDNCFEFVVQLPAPVTIYGHERDVLLVNTKFDGSPSSYTKYSDSMIPA